MKKARGIIMSPAMAKAVWDGRKTQTRRLASSKFMASVKPGDALYVRERFRLEVQFDDLPPNYLLSTGYKSTPVWYGADGEPPSRSPWDRPYGKLRPSIHMPRWAGRMMLHVTEVRTEMLHAITEADAKAEGAQRVPEIGNSYRAGFRDIWDGLHGAKPDACWTANPDVIALTFRVEKITKQSLTGGHREN